MRFHPARTKDIDTYTLTKVILLDDTVEFYIKSTTTSKEYKEFHKIEDYGKRKIRKLLKAFIPTVKRIDYTDEYFEDINRQLPIQPIALKSKFVISGAERSKFKNMCKSSQKIIKHHEKLGTTLITEKDLPSYDENSKEYVYYKAISNYTVAKAKLENWFKTDIEYRQFLTDVTVTNKQATLDTVNCQKTKNPYLLTVFHMRGNDTIYFASYNTATQQLFCSTHDVKIKHYLDSINGVMIMDKIDALYLQAIVNDIDVRYINYYDILEEIKITPLKVNLPILTIQELTKEYRKTDLLISKCYKYMKVSSHDEAQNCLQRVECLKYLFNTELIKQLVVRASLQRLVDNSGLNLDVSKTPLSEIADKLLYSGHESTFTYDSVRRCILPPVGTLLHDFLSNKANDLVKRNEHNKGKDLNVCELFGVNMKIGKNGLAGLRGCLENYVNSDGTKVVHIDFSSFYPTILLNNWSICDVINRIEYKKLYNAKFTATNPDVKEMYKLLINTATGLLGTQQNYNLRHRDSYIAMIKLGQVIMLNLLHKVLEDTDLKLLHVNTDGCYIEAPEHKKIEVEHQYPIKIEEYKKIFIKRLNDYILVGDTIVAKGVYKTCECDYVKNLVHHKLVYGTDYSEIKYSQQDLLLYNGRLNTRYIIYTGSFNQFKVDEFGINYITEYNTKNPDKAVEVDLQAYWKLADQYLV